MIMGELPDLAKVLGVNTSIKRVLYVDEMGFIKADQVRKRWKPLFTMEELAAYAQSTASRSGETQKWNDILGAAKYTITIREKVTVVHFHSEGGTIVVIAARRLSQRAIDRIRAVLYF